MGCKIGGPLGGDSSSTKIGDWLLAHKLTVDFLVRRVDGSLPISTVASRDRAGYRFWLIWDRRGDQDNGPAAAPTLPNQVLFFSGADPGTAIGPTPIWYVENNKQMLNPFRHPLGYGRYVPLWSSRPYYLGPTKWYEFPNFGGTLVDGGGVLSTQGVNTPLDSKLRKHRFKIRFPRKVRNWYRDVSQTGATGTNPYQSPVLYFIFTTDWQSSSTTAGTGHYLTCENLSDVFSYYDP